MLAAKVEGNHQLGGKPKPRLVHWRRKLSGVELQNHSPQLTSLQASNDDSTMFYDQLLPCARSHFRPIVRRRPVLPSRQGANVAPGLAPGTLSNLRLKLKDLTTSLHSTRADHPTFSAEQRSCSWLDNMSRRYFAAVI